MCQFVKLTHFLPFFAKKVEILQPFCDNRPQFKLNMELMQFIAIVFMTGLTLKLLLLPRRVEEVDFSQQEASGKYVCSICGYVYDPAEHDGVAVSLQSANG